LLTLVRIVLGLVGLLAVWCLSYWIFFAQFDHAGSPFLGRGAPFLVGLLAARLRFEDFVRRHPESLEVELEPPVIVVGLPRSGTTHLVNLLATDRRFRSLPWWECLEPTPFPGDGAGRDGVDPRFRRCLEAYETQRASAPLLAAMHDRHPSVIEEDCELVELDLCSYTLEWYARVPLWRDHYLALDHDAHYAFLRRQLQVLSHLRGPNRWVLKTPQHLEHLGPLLRTFPDATIALTLRDPVAVLQSAITMLGWGERMRRVQVDADGLAAYWLDRIEHETLRKPGLYDEPRVHYAVNCASIGCPALRNEAYVGDRLDAQLAQDLNGDTVLFPH
jgi:hypothetical protein